MKSPDEIKKGLECCSGDSIACKFCPYNNYLGHGCTKLRNADALTRIQQLEALNYELGLFCEKESTRRAEMNLNYVRAINAIAAQVPKWISVKERLPERAMKCLVRSKAGRAFTTWYDPEVYRFAPHFAKSNVTHWMHLPRAPKEEA